ncbi:DNA helicase II [Halothiobacillus diazotrophicus]|uniref:DNA 3'-5' helicase n=1 Tax=Halothiobacillus diazotrophicus TaxID=1860122 RepID=A0A191ZKA0_9GAMM|nr:DNA helicase II [Halothiobacillus diazotrophicus]ANJ68272.1 DNA helicase II [Halothiobacillus diazotrophicus]
MMANRILDPLNVAQREAVTSPSLATLILAGAGSGKTRVLTHRMAWLCEEQGLSPHSLLAVTFTNKAAGEMRSRLSTLLNPTGDPASGVRVNGLWVGTFHGLSHRLLRQHFQEAKLPQTFQIIDSDDQLRLIKRLLREANLDDTRWPPKMVAGLINGWKEEGLRSQHLEASGDPLRDQVIQLYRSYEDVCQRGGLVDFTELLLRATELLRDHDVLRAHYQRRFKQVLIDEFQDTNGLQYAWARLLIGPENGIFAVGDDDQSIYGWRGARIEHIQNFSRDFSNTHLVRLEQNYRSTGHILDAANAIIARNQGRLGKNLWTEGERGAPIQYYLAFNELDEADFVARQIEQLVRDGLARSDCAILYRANALSRVFEEALIRAGLPYRIYGGLRFFDRAEIRDALGYLRLMANRGDDAAFERVVNTPARGLGDKTIMQLRELARARQEPLWQAAQYAVAQGQLAPRASGSLTKFMQLIEGLSVETANETLADRVARVIEASGLRDLQQKDRDRERGEARLENLDELVSAARSFDFDPETAAGMSELDAFLSQTSLDAGDAQGAEWEDCVKLMTLHAAKGLEFPHVFLVGMEEGLFPHQMALDEPGRLEEERRLCYVGITRAQKTLTLTSAESRRLHGRQMFPVPSRFLGELPPDLIHEIRPRASQSFQTRQAPSGLPPRPTTTEEGGWSIGQAVRHAKFGEGTIIDHEGSGASTRVLVNFGIEGSKWLILSYANLTAI